MFSQIVGQVDWNAAFVLVALFAAISVPLVTAIAKRRSKQELTMQFEIDRQKLRNDDANNQRNSDRAREFELAKLASERDVQFKRIESGLIEGKVVS